MGAGLGRVFVFKGPLVERCNAWGLRALDLVHAAGSRKGWNEALQSGMHPKP